MLTEMEIETMRDEIARVSLPDEASLLAPTNTKTPTGYTTTWASVWTGMGRISPLERGELERLQRLEVAGTWAVSLPHDAPATEAQRVSILGQTYEITSVLDESSYDLYTRMIVAEIG